MTVLDETSIGPDEEGAAVKAAFMAATGLAMQALLALNLDPTATQQHQKIFVELDRQIAAQASAALAERDTFPIYSAVLLDHLETLRDLVRIAATSPPGAKLEDATDELATMSALMKGRKR